MKQILLSCWLFGLLLTSTMASPDVELVSDLDVIKVCPSAASTSFWRIWLKPNQALTLGQLKFFFLIVATGSLGFAGWFAWQGLWVPLPFAGAELMLLWLCLRHVWYRNQHRYELIEVGPQQTLVSSNVQPQPQRFQTGWLQVELRRDRRRWYPKRLWLRSHGRETEVGTFLAERELEAAAEQLQGVLQTDRSAMSA